MIDVISLIITLVVLVIILLLVYAFDAAMDTISGDDEHENTDDCRG